MKKLTWIALILGISAIALLVSVAASAAPSPALVKKTSELLNYVVQDRPDDRPLVGVQTIGNSGDLVVGTDEAVYFYSDHHYIKTLHHMVWEMFKAGDYIYAVINPYHRKSMYANRVVYRTKDGRNWQRISGKGGTRATLFAVDTKHDVLYGATQTGNYHSTLYKKELQTGVATALGDKRLHRIDGIGWFQGALYVVCDSGKLYMSQDQGKSFVNITHKLDGNLKGRIRILANEHYLLISVAAHYLHQFDGKKWREIAVSATKHDNLSMVMIRSLDGHRLIFAKGLRHHFIMDLRTRKKQQVFLPEVYHYRNFVPLGEDLYVTAHLPEDSVLSDVSGTKQAHEQQEKASQLLKVRLTPEPICNQLFGAQTLVRAHLPVRGIVIDSGQVIVNTGKELLDINTYQPVNNNRFHIANRFKKGAVKGIWYIRMIPETSGSPKDHHYLRWSSDRGKRWTRIANTSQEGVHAVIDDSLCVAYSLGFNNIWRTSIKPQEDYNSAQEVFEGSLESLVVDKTSRVWVQGSEGVFVSKSAGGWWKCPQPFRNNDKIAIRGFALLDKHMAVTYRDQLYLSENNTVNWKPFPIIDPCRKQQVAVRIIGNNKSHIILKDRLCGQLWIVDVLTGAVQHCRIPKTNGVAYKAHLSGNTLLVETTGTPIQSAHTQWKGATASRLFVFNLKKQKS
ncbi:hypothetical protein [Aquimarina algiphila]|uniref:Exo-alpha-sialidase n=1 Tax=Aquimarina algiphila TaxID=2047982 RepID=A0A554VCG0_9FLAO|nr:hypothetical protein [Aquimarina algiphila]TSE04388.1 hypothetical protein FOF46_26545 [Aquimarina algiphila]